MCLSYGELVAIDDSWNKWKQEHNGRRDAGACFDFIAEECAEVYPSEAEQIEIFTYIGYIEEAEA